MFSEIPEQRKNTVQYTILIFVILVIHHPAALWGQELLSDSEGKHMQKPLRFAFVVGCQMCFYFCLIIGLYWEQVPILSAFMGHQITRWYQGKRCKVGQVPQM